MGLFKPDATPQDVVAWAEKEFQKAHDARLTFERQWLLNLAFYYGKQWVTWGPEVSNSRRLSTPRAPRWRVRLTVNKIQPYVRRETARLSSQKPRGFVVPTSSDEADRSAARVANSVVEFLNEDLQLDAIHDLCDWWTCVAGSGYYKVRYTQDEIDTRTTQPGKLVVDVIRPFDIYVPDIEETRIREQAWVCQAQSIPVDKIHEVWGVDVVSDADISEVDQRVRSVMSIFNQNKGEDHAVVKEFWIKPCRNFPEGLVFVVCNGKLLPFAAPEPVEELDPDGNPLPPMEDEYPKPEGTIEWPYGHGRLPFIQRGHTLSGRFYDTTFVEQLISLQREYNRSRSQIIENKNLTSRPQWAVPTGAVDKDQLTTEPGAVISYQFGMQPPTPIQPPMLPNYVIEHVKLTAAEMDEIASQNEVSKGSVPPGVEAACSDTRGYAFTRNGFKNYRNLEVGEEILTYNPKLDKCEWQPVNHVYWSEFEGKLLKLENNNISSRTTLKHRWIVRKRKGNKYWEEKRSDELNSNDLIPTIRPRACDVESFYSENFCRLVGIVMTDGTIPKGGGRKTVEGSQSRGNFGKYPEIYRCIHDVCDEYNSIFSVAPTHRADRFSIQGLVAEELRDILTEDKIVSHEWVSSLSQKELEAFIDGCWLGDGSITGRNGTSRSLTTIYKKYASIYSYAVALAGFSANTHAYKRDDVSTGVEYRVTISNDLREFTAVEKSHEGTVDYKGVVWCPVVDNSYWVCYRNGKVHITGNTAISYLQERDDAALTYAVHSKERAVQEINQQLLSLVTEFWDQPRLVRVVGMNEVFDTQQLRGTDLRDNTDYRVVSGSSAPVSRAAKKAEILELTKAGGIPWNHTLRMIDLPDVAALVEEVERDTVQATRENLQLSKGMFPPVEIWHDHVAHIEEHDSYKKREEYEHLDDQTKAMFRFHDYIHLMQMAMILGIPFQEDPNVQAARMGDPATGEPPVDPFAVDPMAEMELRKILVMFKAGGAPQPVGSGTPA